MAWRFWRRQLHAMHGGFGGFGSFGTPGGFGPQWHAGPGAPHESPWGQRGPHWGGYAGHAGHGGPGHHHGPSREEMIAHLEQYQRDLEEETIAVAARIKELRAAATPGTPPGAPAGNRPGGETSPPSEGAPGTPVL